MINSFSKALCLSAAAWICYSGAAQASPLFFYPSSGWTQSADCKTSTVFNNGYALQISQNALSIDFQQTAFQSGDDFTLNLRVPGIDPKPFAASAITDQILSVDLSSNDAFSAALLQADILDFTLDGNDFRFSLKGLQKASAGFATCGQAEEPEIIIAAPADVAIEIEVEDIIVESVVTETTKITETYSTPEPVVTRDVTSLDVDLTPIADAQVRQQENAARFTYEARIARLEQRIAQLQNDNKLLTSTVEDLQTANPSALSTYALSADNWDLERATLRFQEAERQLKTLGQKLQRERAQCKLEQTELEAMLFDPQITNERQLAELSALEAELAEAQAELIAQRVRYEEQIKVLQSQSGL